MRHFADAANVFGTFRERKTGIGAQAVADLVAIEREYLAAQVEQRALECVGQRGLAGAGQAGDPDLGAAVAGPLAPLLVANGQERRQGCRRG